MLLFDALKAELLKPPTLLAPTSGLPLILYISNTDLAISTVLAQADHDGIERPVYYLSHVLNTVEQRYQRIEKACWALVFAAQKLRHYFLTHEVYLVVHDNLVRHLLQQPALSVREARWLFDLLEFDIKCITHKAIKGQALAELLADNPPATCAHANAVETHPSSFLEWTLYFDGSAIGRRGSAGPQGRTGIVLVETTGKLHLYAFRFTFYFTNNPAEYDALVLGLQLTQEYHVQKLLIRGDSLLVIQQGTGVFASHEPYILGYKRKLENFCLTFKRLDLSMLLNLVIEWLMP